MTSTDAAPAARTTTEASSGAGAPDSLSYQPALDGLRALAVAAVVAFHLDERGLTGGFLGVDAFFVLSGFLITTLLVLEWRRRAAQSAGSIGLLAFWGRRARRLLPALLLLMAAVAIYAALEVPTDQLDRLRGDGIAGLFYVANWRFISVGQSYFDLFASPSPFRHLWSLAIEEQFYLVWPLVSLACLRLGRGRLRVLAGVALAGVIASSALMAVLFDGDDPSRAYYGTDSHAHPILIGALLALVLIDRGTPSATRAARRTVDVLGLVAVVAVIAAFFFAHDTSPRLYRGGSLAFAVAVAVVIGAVMRAPQGVVARGFAFRPFVGIGVISYGIYLWHWPIIVYATGDRVGLTGFRLQLLQIGLTLGAAIASYVLVERPIRRGFRGRRSWVWAPAGLAAGLVAVLVGTAGATSAPAYLQTQPSDPPSTSSTTLGPITLGDPKHVVLVGDSLALSLGLGLDEAFTRRGIPFEADAVPGCGILRGVTLDPEGRPYDWSRECDQAITPALETVMTTEPKPDLVLWLSTWDAVDREVDGQRYAVGTPTGDAVVAREIRAAADRITAHGARLMILQVADPVPGTKTPLPGLDLATRVVSINELYRSAAPTEDPRVRVLDLGTIVCPNDDCARVVDGVELRPDGAHFSEAGSRWVGERLSEVVLACWHDPNGCR